MRIAAALSALLFSTPAFATDWNVTSIAGTQPASAASTTSAPATATRPATAAATSTAPAATAASKPAVVNAFREFSQPEWTVKTFAESIKLNDADSLAACFSKFDDGDIVSPAYLDVVYNSMRLNREVAQRFGDDATDKFEVTSMNTSLKVAGLAAAGGRLRKTGNSALLRISDDVIIVMSPDAVTQEWKIAPATFVGFAPSQKAASEKQIPVLKAISQALDDTRKDIAAGKHATADAAARAYRMHVAALTKAARAAAATTSAPATAPATQPASPKTP